MTQPAAANIGVHYQPPKNSHFLVQPARIALEAALRDLIAKTELQRRMGINHDAQHVAARPLFHDVNAIDESEFLAGAIVHGGKSVIISLSTGLDHNTLLPG